MSAPDFDLIAEVLLFAEGFSHAKVLAVKIVSLFKLCKQLLSLQQHYDWGLRALKPILNTGGQLYQQALKETGKPDAKGEALLLIKTIRINTMSKLTYAYSIKFEGISADMFPGIKSEDISYEELTAAIKATMTEMKISTWRPRSRRFPVLLRLPDSAWA